MAKQKYRELYAKVELLNYQFAKVDVLEGVITSPPSFNIDSNSDIRRTCNFTIQTNDSSFDIKNGNKIWFNKYIRVYMGIKDIKTKEVIYTNMGLYLLDAPNTRYSATENSINLSGLDLMSKLNGMRGGNLEGFTHVIPQGSNVRNVIINTLKIGGFNNYVCEECSTSVPNTINIDVGASLYDILKQLQEIDMTYEMYFDVDGVFYYKQRPIGLNEQIMVDNDLWDIVLADVDKTTDFTNVFNDVTVIGKTHDVSNFATTVTVVGDTYVLNIPSITTIADIYSGIEFGFVAPYKIETTNVYININNLTTKRLFQTSGEPLKFGNNIYYIIRDMSSYFSCIGEVTNSANAKDTNPSSPFYIGGEIGVRNLVLSGGEYDNIYTAKQCRDRVKYELYTNCKLKDNITIAVLPIFWLDVNWVVSFKAPNEDVAELYIIKSVSTDTNINGVQKINMMKYYPLYP